MKIKHTFVWHAFSFSFKSVLNLFIIFFVRYFFVHFESICKLRFCVVKFKFHLNILLLLLPPFECSIYYFSISFAFFLSFFSSLSIALDSATCKLIFYAFDFVPIWTVGSWEGIARHPRIRRQQHTDKNINMKIDVVVSMSLCSDMNARETEFFLRISVCPAVRPFWLWYECECGSDAMRVGENDVFLCAPANMRCTNGPLLWLWMLYVFTVLIAGRCACKHKWYTHSLTTRCKQNKEKWK